MGEDQKISEIAYEFDKIKKLPDSQVSKNLSGLLTVKKGEFPKYDGRLVIGETLKPLNKIPDKIEILNKVDPNWDKKTVGYLNASSDYDRKITITKKGSLIGLNKNYGIYLEQASISFLQRDGSKGSFEALINSENGSIEIVISKNINESIQEPELIVKSPESQTNPFANASTPEEIKELNEGNTTSLLEILNQENLANFDPNQYEEELVEQERKNNLKNSEMSFKKYVDEIKRQISTKPQ